MGPVIAAVISVEAIGTSIFCPAKIMYCVTRTVIRWRKYICWQIQRGETKKKIKSNSETL
jgi:hypothetical protein